MNRSLSMQKQRGLATLIFSLVVLFTLTITTIFGSRVSLMEEKMSGNDFRAKQSMMAAEAGMHKVVADLQASATGDPPGGAWPYTWTDTINDPSTENGITLSYTATATLESDTDDDFMLVRVVSTGCVGLDDCSGTDLESTVTIQQYVASVPLLGDAPAAPLVLAGGLDPSGTWDIVGKSGNGSRDCSGAGSLDGDNEDNCGSGDLISVWSEEQVDGLTGEATSCAWADYIGSDRDTDGDEMYDDIWGINSSVPICATDHNGGDPGNCACSNGASGKNSLGKFVVRSGRVSTGPDVYVAIDESWKLSTDIVGPPVVDYPVTNFPSDLFAYVFGIPKTSASIIKKAAENKGRLKADCSEITHESSGLYWITGDCTLGDSGDVDMGSPARPVLIIVEDAALRISAGVEGYGFLMAAELTAGAPNASFLGNTGLWYGGIIVEYPDVKTNGNGAIVYRDGIFANLQKVTAISYGVVPGTWKDF